MKLLKLENNKITSLQLVKEINYFRGIQINLGTEINLKELRHDTLLNIIRDEFEEEISLQEILERKYLNRGREYPMFCLSVNQAKQILVRESKVVRKAVIKRLDELENKILVPSYQITDPIARAKAWIQEQKEKRKLLKQQKEDKPKVEFYEAVTGSSDTFDLGTVSKVINKKGFGRNNLFEFLRENKILMQNNQPYQKYVDQGLFRMVESKFTKPNGDTCINIKTVVFQKGVDYITKMLNKEVI